MPAIPVHLSAFVVQQDYAAYTPVDHAVWRYVMRQNLAFLEDKAASSYLEGLRAAGISVEHIPNVDEMNASLERFGWGAVVVDGIIPATVFMEFQAHRLLPISVDIRSHEHIAYTPAPDIIHETAGHAPIIHDAPYARFLQRFGEIGARAFASKADHELYEATRVVSILKEDPGATPDQVAAAELALARRSQAIATESEATLIGRLYWWTVEYGLVGPLEAPKLYGAGLLSSVGESQHCFTDAVVKRPIDLDAMLQSDYDITRYQPQLFVCRDFDELNGLVEAFAARMACRTGGTAGALRALGSGNTATLVFSSGLQLSGTLAAVRLDAAGEASYVKTQGASALAVGDQELTGHGRADHPAGIGSPVGRLVGTAGPLEALDAPALAALGLVAGGRARLAFTSGVIVEGPVEALEWHGGRLVLVRFGEAEVRDNGERIDGGPGVPYVMAVGDRLTSAFAGAADRTAFHEGLYHPSPIRRSHHEPSEQDKSLHALFGRVRAWREGPATPGVIERELPAAVDTLDARHPSDWLLRLELLELVAASPSATLQTEAARLRAGLERNRAGDNRRLIDNGLALLALAPAG